MLTFEFLLFTFELKVKMKQTQFALRAIETLSKDNSVIGLAAGGSLLSNELDDFSDIDLVLVTKEKVAGNFSKMLDYAGKLGNTLTAFTGEHVGEPRLLICLYDNPLLHVDIKFVTLEEFGHRVEDPQILLDREGILKKTIESTHSEWPFQGYQWIEDRFWTFVHYALLKIGRGEYFEAVDFLAFLRMTVLGPLLHIKNGNLPRGVRKVETKLTETDFEKLKSTIATYNRQSIMDALHHSIIIYTELRSALFEKEIIMHSKAEERVMAFYKSLIK